MQLNQYRSRPLTGESYYIVRQEEFITLSGKNITLSSSKCITLSGDVITLTGDYYIIGCNRRVYVMRVAQCVLRNALATVGDGQQRLYRLLDDETRIHVHSM